MKLLFGCYERPIGVTVGPRGARGGRGKVTESQDARVPQGMLLVSGVIHDLGEVFNQIIIIK